MGLLLTFLAVLLPIGVIAVLLVKRSSQRTPAPPPLTPEQQRERSLRLHEALGAITGNTDAGPKARASDVVHTHQQQKGFVSAQDILEIHRQFQVPIEFLVSRAEPSTAGSVSARVASYLEMLLQNGNGRLPASFESAPVKNLIHASTLMKNANPAIAIIAEIAKSAPQTPQYFYDLLNSIPAFRERAAHLKGEYDPSWIAQKLSILNAVEVCTRTETDLRLNNCLAYLVPEEMGPPYESSAIALLDVLSALMQRMPSQFPQSPSVRVRELAQKVLVTLNIDTSSDACRISRTQYDTDVILQRIWTHVDGNHHLVAPISEAVKTYYRLRAEQAL